MGIHYDSGAPVSVRWLISNAVAMRNSSSLELSGSSTILCTFWRGAWGPERQTRAKWFGGRNYDIELHGQGKFVIFGVAHHSGTVGALALLSVMLGLVEWLA